MLDFIPTTDHERLAEVRLQAGYKTASDAARAFGWNENTYRSHENGERGLKHSVVVRYAKAFRTTAQYILFGEKPLIDRATGFVEIRGSVAGFGPVASYGDDKNPFTAQLMVGVEHNPFIAVIVAENIFNSGFENGDLLLFLQRDVDWKDLSGAPALIVTNDRRYIFRRVSYSGEGFVNISTSLDGIELSKPAHLYPLCCIVKKSCWHMLKKSDAVERRDQAIEMIEGYIRDVKAVHDTD